MDFVLDSIRRSDLSAKLFACGRAHYDDRRTEVWEIGQSKVLRLLNLLVYLLTLRSFGHFGFLLRMWTPLVAESPRIIVFYTSWTGLFLLFWRRLTGSRARLVRDWFDLSTRMQFYGWRIGLAARILLNLEEQVGPSCFDGLIVPTRFARRLLQSWGHPMSKTHVLGEVRRLNRYVNRETLEGRARDIRKGHPLHVVWVGTIRQYQIKGLVQFLHALIKYPRQIPRMIIHFVGPGEPVADELAELERELPPEITVQRHGLLTSDDMDWLLSKAHAAVHPLPDELFCAFIFSRKMADYLAASLPVAFSNLAGLRELGDRIGTSFDLGNPRSVVEAIGGLSVPDNYEAHLLQAWRVAHDEYSNEELEKKARQLIHFLRKIVQTGEKISHREEVPKT